MGEVKSTSFKKGQSGNPKGRPKKGLSWAEAFRELGEKKKIEICFTDKENKKVEWQYKSKTNLRKAIVSIVYMHALKGDIKAIQLIVDRVEGKPIQPMDHSGELNENIQVIFGDIDNG